MRSITYSADIPFTRDDARSMLPVMVACLTAFVCLLLSVSVSLSSQASRASSVANAGFQLVVPAKTAGDAAIMARITKLVKETSGVKQVTVVGHDKMQDLLKPWLGEQILFDALDVPVLLDVVPETSVGAISTTALLTQLQAIDRAITLEQHGPWQRDVSKAARLVHVFLLGLAIVLLACVVGMVVLLARMALKLHFKTVSLLHLFGASDAYISKQFERNSMRLVARGAFVGVGLAVLAFLALIHGLSGHENPLLPVLRVSGVHVVLWLSLPVFISFMSVLATRVSVQRMLSPMH